MLKIQGMNEIQGILTKIMNSIKEHNITGDGRWWQATPLKSEFMK